MKKISYGLIILGILIFSLPVIGARYLQWQQSNLLADVGVNKVEVIAARGYLEEDFSTTSFIDNGKLNKSLTNENSEEVEVKEEEEIIKNSIDIFQPSVEAIGRLEIQQVDIDLPIFADLNHPALNYGVGIIEGTASLGEIGNTGIAGHSGHSFSEMFNRLHDVSLGDEIKITKKDGTVLIYSVYSIGVVMPEDISVLRGTKKHRVVTLITCTPIGSKDFRLIVQGIVE